MISTKKVFGLIILLFLCAAKQYASNIASIISETRNCENFNQFSSTIQKAFINSRCKRTYVDCDSISNLSVEIASDSILYYLLLGNCHLYSPIQDPSTAYQFYLRALAMSEAKQIKVATNECLVRLINYNLFTGQRLNETEKLIIEHNNSAYDREEILRNRYFELRLQSEINGSNNNNNFTKKEDWYALLKEIDNNHPKLQSDIESYFGLELEGMKDFDESRKILTDAITSAKSVSKDYYELTKFGSLANIGFQYLENKDPKTALFYFKDAANVPKTMNSDKNYSMLYSWISTAYKVLNQSDSAYHYLNLSNEIAAREQSKIQEIKLKEIHSKYDNDKLASDLILEKQRRELAYTWLGISIFFGLSLLLFYRNQVLQKKTALQKIKANKLQADLEKQQALQNERNRIAAEMHDDLGGGLTSIKYLSQKAIKKNDIDSTKEQLEKIVTHAQTLVSNMSEIIWAMNTGYDTLENLVGYIRRYTNEFLEAYNIELSFNAAAVNTNPSITGSERRSVFLVVKEALHNIVKHAQATKVQFKISCNEWLNLEICDNGIGIQQGKKGNGLRNMKQRVEKLNGELIFSNCQPGTKILITIPINKQDLDK